MQVEDVARVCLTPRRAAQQQRDRTVGFGLLGQIVEDDEHVFAVVHPVLADGRTGIRGDVFEACGIGGRGGHDGGVLHRAGFLKALLDGGDGRALLTDGHVDAADLLLRVTALPVRLLVDDGVDRNGGLAGLAVADDELTLAAADRRHGVDGLQTGGHRLVDRMAVHDVRCLRLENTAAFALNRAQTVDRVAQRVHDTAQIAVADRHGQHFAGAADLLALLDACEVAEDNHTDLAGVKVERQAERAVLEGQQLVGHATRQSLHMRNAIAGRGHIAHFLGGRVARLVRLDEILERTAYRGGINGQFCHDHSLLMIVMLSGTSLRSASRWSHGAAAAAAGPPRCCRSPRRRSRCACRRSPWDRRSN